MQWRISCSWQRSCSLAALVSPLVQRMLPSIPHSRVDFVPEWPSLLAGAGAQIRSGSERQPQPHPNQAPGPHWATSKLLPYFFNKLHAQPRADDLSPGRSLYSAADAAPGSKPVITADAGDAGRRHAKQCWDEYANDFREV